jgi:hypothetical protein
MWFSISISSSGQYQSAVISDLFYTNKIYTSSDYGNTWSVSSSSPSKFWKSISVSSNGKYQSAIGSSQIYISSDYGNTWSSKDSNRDWRILSVSSSGQYQSAVVYSGQIYTSSDYGNTWTSKLTDSNRNWKSISVSSSGQYQSSVVYGGQIYTSSDYGNTWSVSSSSLSKNWQSISISCDLPKCKNNTNISYVMKDIDDWNVYSGSYLMTIRKKTNNVWNPSNSLSGSNYSYNGNYKILVSFSEPVNITNIYLKIINNLDTTHIPDSLVLYPNIYIGNSSNNTAVNILKMNPEPSMILNSSLSKLTTDFNYYVNNPIKNSDTGFYSNYTIVFNKSLPWQMYLNYLDFDIVQKIQIPNKIIINSVSSSIGNVNIDFNIPSSQVSKYIIRKYTDKNTCSYKELLSTDDLLSNKNIGDTVNYKFPITTKTSFSGDTTNLTTNCSIENYKYIPYKNINNYDKYDDYAKIPIIKNYKEPYIFTLKAVNSAGESEISNFTSDTVPIVLFPIIPLPTGPSSTGSTGPSAGPSATGSTGPSAGPSSTGSTGPSATGDNNNLYIYIGVILFIIIFGFGFGFWYISNKNKKIEKS